MNVLRPVVSVGSEMVPVDGAMAAGTVAALVARLAEEAAPEGRDACAADPDEALAWIMAAFREDAVLICGGLRAEDPAGVRVDPSCCCDLVDWREWIGFAERPRLWLGHSPDPWVEYLEAGLRVHPDKASPSKPSVEFSNDELPGLLSSVRGDLLGFLDAVRAWTAAHVPGREGEFAAALEQIIGISAPLPWAR